MVETIAIASGKGGVGKTSLAVNCAVKLSNEKNSVGLLDADFGLANAHIMLDQKVTSSISDLLDGTITIDELVHVYALNTRTSCSCNSGTLRLCSLKVSVL